MSSRTKIVVLRMKEIIYTAIFIGLGILLITLLFIMFGPGKDTSETASAPAAAYVPGVYSASIVLGSQNVKLSLPRMFFLVNFILTQYVGVVNTAPGRKSWGGGHSRSAARE